MEDSDLYVSWKSCSTSSNFSSWEQCIAVKMITTEVKYPDLSMSYEKSISLSPSVHFSSSLLLKMLPSHLRKCHLSEHPGWDTEVKVVTSSCCKNADSSSCIRTSLIFPEQKRISCVIIPYCLCPAIALYFRIWNASYLFSLPTRYIIVQFNSSLNLVLWLRSLVLSVFFTYSFSQRGKSSSSCVFPLGRFSPGLMMFSTDPV